MIISSKKIFFTALLAFLIAYTNIYSQSEDSQIQELISQKKAYNKKNKNSTVYKIQLYNGNEREAYQIRSNFNTSFPDYNVKIMYKSPEWKTQVGNFNTRLEADRILNIISEKFAGAIVLEDKI